MIKSTFSISLSVIVLLTVALTSTVPAQTRFNPTEAEFPTPLRAIVTAGVEGWHGDLEGLVATLLNSPGDGVKAKVEIEVSGGAGGGGGILIELEGMFSRTVEGRYELSVGGDLSAFAGAEVIQDVEAKAAATLGGKMVFVFDTATEAAQALRDLAIVQLAETLDFYLVQTMQGVERLEAAAHTLRARAAEIRGRVRALVDRIDDALRALDQVPGFRVFAPIRAAARSVVIGLRAIADRARTNLEDTLDELHLADRILARARSVQALLLDLVRGRAGLVPFLRDHFAAIEATVKVSGEAEARVDLADALLPGISLQGDQWGVGGKVEAGISLRIVRGLAGARHQVETAIIMSAEGEAEGAVVVGLHVKAKVAAELKRIYEVPTLDDLQAFVTDMLAMLEEVPATWPRTLTSKAQERAWHQLGLVRSQVAIDVQAEASAAVVAGGALGLGRATTMEVAGDDAVATLWAALCAMSASAAADGRAFGQDPSLDQALIAIQHAFLAPLEVARTLGSTPATFTVQDRFQGGLLFMLGYSAAQCGAAASGSIQWIDKGLLRSETLPAYQGLDATIAGSVYAAVLGLGAN